MFKYFIVGCIISYFSPNFFILLLSRVLEAVGAGVIFTLTLIVMVYIFTKNSHAKALGYLGLVIGLALCIGPTLAGYIVDYSSWRNIFLLLAFICLIVIVLLINMFIILIRNILLEWILHLFYLLDLVYINYVSNNNFIL